MTKLDPFYVVPGYNFFNWGITLPAGEALAWKRHFRLSKARGQTKEIILVIGTKKFPAKVGLAKIRDPKYPKRDVIRISYDRDYDTKKALRRLFLYSYARQLTSQSRS